jgi:iron complex outermembrane recepter protein
MEQDFQRTRRSRRRRALQQSLAILALAPRLAAGHADGASDRLAEVVVLAQKRPIELQRVPAPVTTLTAVELAAAGIREFDILAARSPTLDRQQSVTAATTTLRIRRVGNLGNIPTFEPSVGLFVDGAFRSRSLFASGSLHDVERVEILRGPQTSLYGKNVGGGVVALYTRPPEAQFQASAEVSGGYLDAPGDPALVTAAGRFGGPLSGDLRGSLSLGGAWHDDTAHNALAGGPDGNAQARIDARGQLAWSTRDGLDLRLIAGYLGHDGEEGESDAVFAPGARSTQILESVRLLDPAATCPDNRPRNRIFCSVATNRLDLVATDATLIADYRLANGWMFHALTGHEHYRDRRDEDDAMQLMAPLLYFHDSEESTAWQQELRLASADGARSPWLAGAFWYDSNYERGSHGERPMFGPNGDLAFDPFWISALGIPLAIAGQQGLHDSRLDTEYVGVYGQFTVPMGNHLELTGAMRWAREEKEASIENAVTAPGLSVVSSVLTPATSPTGEPVNGSLRRASEDITWSLTPAYFVDRNRMLYATWVRGGKFGGFNTGFGNAPLAAREYGDEKIDHFEIGGRCRFWDGRGRLNASAFRTRYHEYQDSAFISAQFTVGNAERVNLDGFELESEYLFAPGTRASFALSYANLEYARNTIGMCSPGRTPDGSLPGACDLSGEHPVDAPPWSAHIGIEHQFGVGGLDAAARLDWAWTDAYHTSFSADPRLDQPGYHDIALRLSVRLNESVELELAGENVLGETIVYIDSVLNFFNDASYQSYLAEPRRFAVTLRAHF